MNIMITDLITMSILHKIAIGTQPMKGVCRSELCDFATNLRRSNNIVTTWFL